jgi:hypothetical protein
MHTMPLVSLNRLEGLVSDEYPVEEAEYYYEQLTAKGIPVIIA